MTERIFYNKVLTPKEIENLKIKIADSVLEKQRIDKLKLEDLNTYNDKIEQILFEISSMALSIENGSEEMTEYCEMVENFDKNVMEYTSPTTGEIVFKRELTADERQLKIK